VAICKVPAAAERFGRPLAFQNSSLGNGSFHTTPTVRPGFF
jgi:hypothetical protein